MGNWLGNALWMRLCRCGHYSVLSESKTKLVFSHGQARKGSKFKIFRWTVALHGTSKNAR
eukprot:5894659-Pyramimonas_sp.AAC.1